MLYGTDRNPQPPPLTTTTSSTTPIPTTDTKIRKRNKNDPSPDSPDNSSAYNRPYKYFNTNIKPRTSQSNKPNRKKSQRKKNKKKNRFKYGKNKSGYGRKVHQNSKHMCQFETLAKQNEYYQNMMSKKDLSSGKT